MISPDFKYYDNGQEDSTVDAGERRRHPRMELQVALRCIRLDPDCGQATELLRAVDISRNGMGVVSSKPFYPGQRMILCMPLTNRTGRRDIYASVVRCIPVPEGGYRVGLQFEAPAVDSWCGVSSNMMAA